MPSGLVGGQTFVHQLLFDVVEDDLSALACESRSQRESDAVRGARHERDLTFKEKFTIRLSYCLRNY